ncbi:MAG: putative peroxiredoxin, partial [Bacteroidia bacterium]
MAQRIELTGVLVDGQSLVDLSGVHIYTKEHIGTTSDLDGNFSFKVYHMDTLHFSRVGYDSLAMVITETDVQQNLFVSMKRSITMLDDVEINAVFQANTILKRPKQERLKVRGFNYPDKPYEEDYHMGLSALASPMTALYRIFSKRYKEEKKNYKILKARKLEDVVFTRAS